MNYDQKTGITERVLYGLAMALLTKLVAKGYIDEDLAAYVAGGFVAAVGTMWAWWINRPQAQLRSAATVPGTLIISQPSLANSTPESNIVSSDTTKVVQK